jgi:hypothetical protein
VYEYARRHGIPPDTCSPYVAHNQRCNSKHECFTCLPDRPCSPVADYKRLLVSEHGAVKGRVEMKAEIFKRGPISCGVDSTAELDAYKGGVFAQKLDVVDLNHGAGGFFCGGLVVCFWRGSGSVEQTNSRFSPCRPSPTNQPGRRQRSAWWAGP